MKKTRAFFVAFIIGLLFLAAPAFAKIYEIPLILQQETKAKYQIFKENPSSQEARFELAMAYAYTGRIKKGWDLLKTVSPSYAQEIVVKYDNLSKLEPKVWQHKFKLAFGYYFTNQKELSLVEFHKVLAIDPKNVWAMGFIALVEGDLNQVDECIYWCQKALAIEPNASGIHFLLGEAYRRKGDWMKAFSEIFTVGRLVTEEARLRPDEN